MKSFRMKSLWSICAIVFCVYQAPAQAMVGGSTGDPALVIGGLAVIAGSFGGLFAGVNAGNAEECQGSDSNNWGNYPGKAWYCQTGTLAAIAMTGAVVGLLIMDDSQSNSVQFAPITLDQAKNVGISPTELSAYLNNIDELNSVAATISAKTQEFAEGSVTKQQALTMNAQLWNEYKDSLDPNAFSAAEKIASAVFAK